MNLNNYLSGYLDRRMPQIIVEFQLTTSDDLDDLTRRLSRVNDDLKHLKEFEKKADSTLSNLEERVLHLKELLI